MNKRELTFKQFIVIELLIGFVALLPALFLNTHAYNSPYYSGIRVGDCYNFNLGVNVKPSVHFYFDEC